jgi:hypothetical protein
VGRGKGLIIRLERDRLSNYFNIDNTYIKMHMLMCAFMSMLGKMESWES